MQLQSCFSLFQLLSVTKTKLSHRLSLPAAVCKLSRHEINTQHFPSDGHIQGTDRFPITKTALDWVPFRLLMWLMDWQTALQEVTAWSIVTISRWQQGSIFEWVCAVVFSSWMKLHIKKESTFWRIWLKIWSHIQRYICSFYHCLCWRDSH